MKTEPKVKLADLSAEERAALLAELESQKQNEREERKKYKELASDCVKEIVANLLTIANNMKQAKTKAFDTLRTLAISKGEVFDVKDDQKTHTFTTIDGNMRIVMGVRLLSSWDGTQDAGVSKIKEYLGQMAKDAESKALVEMITGMLKPDKNGMLDPRRIIELSKVAEEGGNDLFIDGINIIMKAHSLSGTQVFLEASIRDKECKWRNINKDFSEIDVDSSWLFQLPETVA